MSLNKFTKQYDPATYFVRNHDPVEKAVQKVFSKPKAPGVTQDQLDLEAMQKEAAAKLDAQENERRKRLLNAAQGIRAYAGSPLFRVGPSDTSGTAAAPAVIAPRGGGGGAGPGGGYSPGTGGGRSPGRGASYV